MFNNGLIIVQLSVLIIMFVFDSMYVHLSLSPNNTRIGLLFL